MNLMNLLGGAIVFIIATGLNFYTYPWLSAFINTATDTVLLGMMWVAYFVWLIISNFVFPIAMTLSDDQGQSS